MRQGAERRWMPRATRRVAVLVGTVVSVGAVVSVSACTGAAPEPPTTTPVTTSAEATSAEATTSPSPTPTAPAEPAKPASWTTGSDDAAVDAAAYFMDLYNYVRATGDLTEWDALSDPGCEFCTNTHTRVAEVYSADGRLEGGTVAVADGSLIDYTPELHVHSVQFAFSASPTTEYDADGAAVRTAEGTAGFVIVEVGFTGDRWMLVTGASRDEPVPPMQESAS